MTGLDPQTMPGPLPDQPFNPWNFRPDVAVELGGTRLAGHRVDALDGRLGRVVDANLTPNDSFLVITTGRWSFGRRLQLPAGTVSHVDPTERTVYLDRTRDQVKAAPEVPPEGYDDPEQRAALAEHYRGTYHT